MSKNIVDAIFIKLGIDITEYKKGLKEASEVSQKFAKDEEKREKTRLDAHKKLTEAERAAAKDRSRQEKDRDTQARAAISQLNSMKSTIMGMMGLSLGAAGVQKFLSVVINGNAELYRQSKMLNTEMKTLDVWMRVADDYRKGSGQGVVGAIQGIKQAKFQATMGTGGQQQMASLGALGIDPSTIDDTDKFMRAIRSKTKGMDSQAQLYWLSQAGLQDLLPITQQTDAEFEKNLTYARDHSAKTQEKGKTAYNIEADKSKINHNLEATADKVSDPLLEIIRKLTKFLTEHADAVGVATGAIWGLGTAAGVAAGARGLGALIGGGGAGAAAGGAGAGGAASAGAAGVASRFAGVARFGVGTGLMLYSEDLNANEDEKVRQSHIGLPGYDAQGNPLPNLRSGGSRLVGGKIGGLGGTGANGGALTTQTQRMQGVIRAFMNQGLSVEQAQILAAEVGRENGFKSELLFGNHTDPANGKKNVGMFSWQGPRAERLLQYLSMRGLVDESGNIRQTQAALNHQAGFFVNEEMKSGKNAKWAKAWEALNDPNLSREEKSNAIGRNGIQWAIDNPKYAASGIRNREDYYTMLTSMGVAGSTINNTNSNNQTTTEVRIDNMTIKTAATDGRAVGANVGDGIKERVSAVGVF